MSMLVVLPFITLLLLIIGCRPYVLGWRYAVLSAVVVWGPLILIITEALSAGGSPRVLFTPTDTNSISAGIPISPPPTRVPCRPFCSNRALT